MLSFLLLFFAQDAASQADRIRAAMQPSLDLQRASVRKQAETAGVQPDLSLPGVPSVPCGPVPESELKPMIDEAARKHSLDPSLVREVARVESGFRPCAVSVKGAEGLMQLMPATQALYQVQNPFSAQENLDAGSQFLKLLLDRYHGDLALALSAYNAGPTVVDQAGGVPEIPATQNYVTEILRQLGAPPVQPAPAPSPAPKPEEPAN
ncbi:MAG TPA: lytic transglycosylase domain-containing protein [Bryobacteraceae bacterium]